MTDRLHEPHFGRSVLTNRDVTEQERTDQWLRRQNGYLAALHETALDVLERGDLASLLAAIVRRAGHIVGASHGYLHWADDGDTTRKKQIDVGPRDRSTEPRVGFGEEIADEVWQGGRPLIVNNYRDWPGHSLGGARVRAHAVIAVPLISDATVIGVMGLVHPEADHPFGDDDADVLAHFAQLATIALEHARLHRAVQRELDERIKTAEALRASEERFRALVEHSSDSITLCNVDGLICYAGPSTMDVSGYHPAELVGCTVLDRLHPDDRDRLFRALTRLHTMPGATVTNSYRSRHKDGSWRWLEGTSTNLLEVPSVGAIVTNQRDITKRKEAEERLMHHALHDALTNLPNRTAFMNRLKRAIGRVEQPRTGAFAVMFLDFDRFKNVNDSLGHLVGDRLLVAIADRLTAGLPPSATLARLGGDEFAILLGEMPDVTRALRYAQEIHVSLRDAFTLGRHQVFAPVSIGIVLDDARYARPEDVLRDADTAMYHAKGEGGGRSSLF